MRRDMWLLVLVLAMVGCGGCGSVVQPESTVDLAPFVDVTPRPDLVQKPSDLRRSDAMVGRWCWQALGDGGRDALAPGEACALNGTDHCAPPAMCSFESFDFDAACLPGAPRDGGGDYRCCQRVKTHNQVTGAEESCENCGAGWSCS